MRWIPYLASLPKESSEGGSVIPFISVHAIPSVTVAAITEMGNGDVKNVQNLLPDWT